MDKVLSSNNTFFWIQGLLSRRVLLQPQVQNTQKPFFSFRKAIWGWSKKKKIWEYYLVVFLYAAECNPGQMFCLKATKAERELTEPDQNPTGIVSFVQIQTLLLITGRRRVKDDSPAYMSELDPKPNVITTFLSGPGLTWPSWVGCPHPDPELPHIKCYLWKS